MLKRRSNCRLCTDELQNYTTFMNCEFDCPLVPECREKSSRNRLVDFVRMCNFATKIHINMNRLLSKLNDAVCCVVKLYTGIISKKAQFKVISDEEEHYVCYHCSFGSVHDVKYSYFFGGGFLFVHR